MTTTRFGIFKAGILGATLECFGLFFSSFADSIPFLVISLGLITGLYNDILFTLNFLFLFFQNLKFYNSNYI